MGRYIIEEFRRSSQIGLLCLLLLGWSIPAKSQGSGSVIVNLSPLDGIPLTPKNIFSFVLQSNLPTTQAEVKGTLRYRQSDLSFSYSFRTTLRQGMNRIDGAGVHPSWTFPGSAFRELFMDYHILPQGTYEYCVTVTPLSANGEIVAGGEAQECLYQKSDDLFLINLIDPDDNAKIYEHYPVFSWVVNYPFASQLTYRIRVAEIKEGQNAIGAVGRNNPMYTESRLPQTSTTYPVYGKPLETFQPYAWTVDAYFKGILLGGAAPWTFTIIDDSEMVGIPRVSPFVDIRMEQNTASYYAVGGVKLKYELKERPEEMLQLQLIDKNGKEIKFKEQQLKAVLGDNRYDINFKDQIMLKHLAQYKLRVSNSSGEVFELPIKYVNPDFFK